MSQVDAILDQVGQISPDERTELQIRLLAAGPADDDVQEAWGNKIARRLDAYRRGETHRCRPAKPSLVLTRRSPSSVPDQPARQPTG